MTGKRGCSGRPWKDPTLVIPFHKSSTDNTGTKDLRMGGLKSVLSPLVLTVKTPVQQEKEVLDLERYDHDDTALCAMPKLRAKPARWCLMDTVIGQSLDRLPTSKLTVMRLVLQWRRSFQCQCYSLISNTSVCQSHYEWSDYVWQLAYVPTKRADTLKPMVDWWSMQLIISFDFGSMVSDEVQIRNPVSHIPNPWMPCLISQLIDCRRLCHLMPQLIPGKKISNWQLELTSRNLMHKPDDSRWRKSIRKGWSGKHFNNKGKFHSQIFIDPWVRWPILHEGNHTCTVQVWWASHIIVMAPIWVWRAGPIRPIALVQNCRARTVSFMAPRGAILAADPLRVMAPGIGRAIPSGQRHLSDFSIPCWPRATGKEMLWQHYPGS